MDTRTTRSRQRRGSRSVAGIMSLRASALQLILAALPVCVQRAKLSAPVVTLHRENSEKGPRFPVRREGSQVEVVAGDLITGDHVLTFDRFDGLLATEPPGDSGTLDFELDLQSMKSDSKEVESVIKNDLLEVDKFPHASLAAHFGPGSGDEREVEGNLVLHGVKKGIRFAATLRPEERGYRFAATFKIERQAFGIHAPKFDSVIYDDLRINLDLAARSAHP